MGLGLLMEGTALRKIRSGKGVTGVHQEMGRSQRSSPCGLGIAGNSIRMSRNTFSNSGDLGQSFSMSILRYSDLFMDGRHQRVAGT